MLVETPSKPQNSRLVSVTTTTNLCDNAAGTSLWDSGASGAPIRCGSAIRPRPRTAAHAVGRKASRQSPAAVAAAVAIHQICRAVSSATGMPGKSGGRPRPAPDRIDPGEQQRETDRGQDIGRDREGVALKPIFGLPFAIIATGIIMMMGGASVLMCSRRSLDRSLAFVNFALLDQRHRSEELRY